MRYVSSLLLILCVHQAFCQSAPEALKNGRELNVLYRNEATFEIFAHTRGFGLNYRRGHHVTGTRKRMFEIEAYNMKHPKEMRISNNPDNSKRFVYGKLNNVLALRAGLGYQNTIFKRSEKKTVEIRYNYFIGGSLAFAKPYYVLVYKENTNGNKVQESVPYDPETMTIDSIAGRGPLLDGLGETRIYPGLYGKGSFSFEFAPYSNVIRAVETGIVMDYYPQGLPIMAKNRAENLIVTIYVGFVFGKKWF